MSHITHANTHKKTEAETKQAENDDNQHPHILVIGQGDIGLPVTNTLAEQGMQVTGLATKERTHYALHPKADFIQADARQLTAEQLLPFHHIAIIVTPNTYSEEAYRATYLGIAEHIGSLASALPNLQRIVFISSTGVYGQDNGEWIDETVAPIAPKRQGSQFILQAETALQTAFADKAIVIRPSGIYGEQRLMRIRKAKEGDKVSLPLHAWTNRIMDTDLVRIIVHILTLNAENTAHNTPLKPLYLATDYRPVTSYELTCWLCQQMDITPPNIDTTHTQMTGKRLLSNIPRDWLTYPDWQMGYGHILQSLDKK